MTVLKVSAFILFYFASRVAFSANCETYQGLNTQERVCWTDSFKGWISESCMKKSCKASEFFQVPQTKPTLPSLSGGYNPDSMICHHLKLPVVVLKDSHNYEQSFCTFPDKTVISADAIGRYVK